MIKQAVIRQRRALRSRYMLRQRNRSGLCRLSVFCSSQHIHVQVIKDSDHNTIASASTLEKAFRELNVSSRNKSAAAWIGERVADRLKEHGITDLILDRGSKRYNPQGKLGFMVDAIRKTGIKI